MLLVKDKWDEYMISHSRGDEWAALDLLRQRVDQGFWYYNYDDGKPAHQYKDRANQIVQDEDAAGALKFLMERREHEYEWVEITQPRQVG